MNAAIESLTAITNNNVKEIDRLRTRHHEQANSLYAATVTIEIINENIKKLFTFAEKTSESCIELEKKMLLSKVEIKQLEEKFNKKEINIDQLNEDLSTRRIISKLLKIAGGVAVTIITVIAAIDHVDFSGIYHVLTQAAH